jgi:hypothetical protein
MYFWLIMTWAALLWYSIITVYVAYKGYFNIRTMLERLKNGQDGV